MRVVFHIGLNKAGSTYLQDALTFNRGRIAECCGIAYPSAPAITKGHSTAQAGNGQHITEALRRRDATALARAISKLANKAGHSETLLISNESAYHHIIDPQAYAMLIDAFAALGYKDVVLVMIFRNIYSHAVSAYAHRAGNYPIPGFATWIRPDAQCDSSGGFEHKRRKPFIEVYEFWRELPRFTQHLVSNDERVRFHLLRQESNILLDVGSLLGVSLEAPGKSTSNVSMNLVEAELARQLWNLSPTVARVYRRLAKETPRANKVSDTQLRNAYYDVVEQHLPTIQEELDVLAEFLSGTDTIQARPSVTSSSDDRLVAPSGLSNDQVAALVSAVRLGEREKRIESLKRFVPRPLRSLGKSILRR